MFPSSPPPFDFAEYSAEALVYLDTGSLNGEEEEDFDNVEQQPLEDVFEDAPTAVEHESPPPIRAPPFAPARDDSPPDPFCLIDQLAQIINARGGQQAAATGNNLEAQVISGVVRGQRAASRTPGTQAPPVPAPATSSEYVGYGEFQSPTDMIGRNPGYGPREVSADVPEDNPPPLQGMQDYAHGDQGNQGYAPPGLVDQEVDVILRLRDSIQNTSGGTPIYQQLPQEGYTPQGGYGAAEEEEEDEESPEQENTPNPAPARRRRSGTPTYTPRARGNRVWPPRSDPHPRFATNDPRAIQDAQTTHTIDANRHAGRNLMGLFDNEDIARTRYRLRLERGRSLNHAAVGYPESHTEIPARLTLREICQRYPNHVWGTGLRLFMHEHCPAELIWQYLPDGVRMKGCKGRPHNYLQQAIGREIDKIMKEDTGRDRQIIKRKSEKDENDEEKPAPKKIRYSGGVPDIAPAPAPPRQNMPFTQYAGTSPYVQHPGHLAAPGPTYHQPGQQPGVSPYLQQPGRLPAFGEGYPPRPRPRPTMNTPLPAASAAPTASMMPGSPLQNVQYPPRTIDDLRRLARDEFGTQEALFRRLPSMNRPMSGEELRVRVRERVNQMIEQMFNNLLQQYNLVRSPITQKNPINLMIWLLRFRPGIGPVRMAENLVAGDETSRAFNWYLAILRDYTQRLRNQAAMEGHGGA